MVAIKIKKQFSIVSFGSLKAVDFLPQSVEAGFQSIFAPCPLMLSDLAADYLPILLFLGIAGFIAAAAVGLSFLLAKQKPDAEKLSPYECGFPPFNDAHAKFDVRFYLISILFIIFDLEVAFLFPWAIALGDIGMVGFWSMILFLGVLTVGFIYEWKKGALEWE